MPIINNNSEKITEERKATKFKINNNEFVKILVINFIVCFLASYMAISTVFNLRFPKPPQTPRRGLFSQEQSFPPPEEMIRRRQEMMKRTRNMPPQQNGQMSPAAYPARRISNSNDQRQSPAAVQYPKQPPMNPNTKVQYGPPPSNR